MSTDKSALADLRREIDAIDDGLHDLLMRRVALTGRIAASKNSKGVWRPAREAEVLRRLLGRHRGPFPKAVVARIWREIIAANTALQSNFAIAVLAERAVDGSLDESLVAVARDHYGCLTSLPSYESASSVLRAVSEGTATAAVLPLPAVDEPDPWWRLIARSGAEVPRIVARLPFAPGSAPDREGLVVSLAPNEPTGRDRSYVVVESEGEVSRSKLKQSLAAAGFAVLELQSWDRQHYLVEVEGFIGQTDLPMEELAAAEGVAQAVAIGSYAVPFTLAELTGAEA